MSLTNKIKEMKSNLLEYIGKEVVCPSNISQAYGAVIGACSLSIVAKTLNFLDILANDGSYDTIPLDMQLAKYGLLLGGAYLGKGIVGRRIYNKIKKVVSEREGKSMENIDPDAIWKSYLK